MGTEKIWERNFLVCGYGKVGTQSVFKHLADNKRISYYGHHENCFLKKYDFDFKKLLSQSTMLIIGVRDPIEQSISSFFQNLADEKGHDEEIVYGTREKILETNTSKIIKFYFDKKILYKPSESFTRTDLIYNLPSIWFEYIGKLLKDNLEIDLLNSVYDKKKGLYLFKNKNVEIFIYKYKYFNEMNSFLNELIGTKGAMTAKNCSKYKWYAKKMKDFISKIKFTKKQLNEIYSSKYSKNFLEEEDIKNNFNKYLYNKYL